MATIPFATRSPYYHTLVTSGSTMVIPSNCSNIIAIHAIGGGQCGFDGTVSGGTPGALGGKGADWAYLDNPALSLFGHITGSSDTNVTVQVGQGGLLNGAAGTDSWVQDKDTNTILLARGGDSATGANIGDDENAGGISQARNLAHGTYIAGDGGSAGGGAAGPDGPGGDGGDLNGRAQTTVGAQPFTYNCGCGGGAANNGGDGASTATVGGTHITTVADIFYDSVADEYYTQIGRDTTGFTWNIIAGDGGDGFDWPTNNDWMPLRVAGDTGVGTLADPKRFWSPVGANFCNGWAIASFSQLPAPGSGAGGSGAIPLYATAFPFTPDPGATWLTSYGTLADGIRAAASGLRAPLDGGTGDLISWGAWFNEPARGPGGGGGGGCGGPASANNSGAKGGFYGGGGGGAGNPSTTDLTKPPLGGPGEDGIIVLIYETSETYLAWGAGRIHGVAQRGLLYD